MNLSSAQRSYDIIHGEFNFQSVYLPISRTAHTNIVEAEFSVFRPWNATFRGYSEEKLHLYTAHYNFLRNTHHMDRAQRALAIIIPLSQRLRVETLAPPAQPQLQTP